MVIQCLQAEVIQDKQLMFFDLSDELEVRTIGQSGLEQGE